MATVTNTVKLPDGSTPDRVDVVIELVASTTGRAAGWITATDVTLEATVRPTVTNGAWTASLTPNADITPSGSVYKVTEYVDKTRYIHYIEVGSGGGSLLDLLTDPPASVEPAALTTYRQNTTVLLPAANGTDDTSAIQAVLDDAEEGQTVKGRVGASYEISVPLVVNSGQRLDMSGCTVTLLAGSACNMVQNAAYAADTGRDSDIEIFGGTWARGSNDGVDPMDRHCIILANVDGVKVHDLTITSSAGKYAISLHSCTEFEVRDATFHTSSDGVHMVGACSHGVISGIYGDTGDDSVAITTVDYPTYNYGTLGDAHDILIERVYTDNNDGTGNTVKVLAGKIDSVQTTAYGITIRDVSGFSAQQAIHLGGDPADADTQDGIIRDMVIDRVENRGAGHAVLFFEGEFSNVTLRRISAPAATTGRAVQIALGAIVKDVTIENCYFAPPASTYAINIATGSPQPSVSLLRVRNCRLRVATKSAGLITTASSSQTLTTLMVEGLLVDQAAWAIGDFYTATDVVVSGLKAVDVTGWFNVRSGATVDVKAAAGMIGNVQSIGNSGTARARDFGFLVDVGLLERTANGIAYNTNASRSCGAGPVVCDGTNWKHLFTGATY